MTTIRLTPSGRLALDLAETDTTPAVQELTARFAADWREGLFCLGARRDNLAHLDAAHFWAGVAARYLTAVCHLSESLTIPEPPGHDELADWVENAPPMSGGEYLRIDMLETHGPVWPRGAREPWPRMAASSTSYATAPRAGTPWAESPFIWPKIHAIQASCGLGDRKAKNRLDNFLLTPFLTSSPSPSAPLARTSKNCGGN